MKTVIVLGALALALAGCQTGGVLYEPVVGLGRTSPARYQRDLAYCRQLAAPHEKVARDAAGQAQAGVALAAIGGALGAVGGGSYRQAVNRAVAGDALVGVGAATAAQGAATADVAGANYAAIVNRCLTRRGHVILG